MPSLELFCFQADFSSVLVALRPYRLCAVCTDALLVHMAENCCVNKLHDLTMTSRVQCAIVPVSQDRLMGSGGHLVGVN